MTVFLNYTVHPALSQLVKRVWVSEFKLDPGLPRPIFPSPPQPENRLFFYPYDRISCKNYADGSTTDLPHSMLLGPQLSRVDLSVGYHMLVIYVGFHPCGLHRLLGIPLCEMIDQTIDARMILGREIEEVTEQLYETRGYDQMNAIVQRYLLQKASRLKQELPVDQVLVGMLQKGNLVNIDKLSQEACVSVRQLERQFKERIGMPPKYYARLVRFSRAWDLRERNPHFSWSQIAYACGYADQMHMIRDFKEFVGVTPTILQKDLENSTVRLRNDDTIIQA